MLDTGTAFSASLLTVCVFLEGSGQKIHYPSSYVLSGIRGDKMSERQRKGENEDLALYPAAFCPAVQLTTKSFG